MTRVCFSSRTTLARGLLIVPLLLIAACADKEAPRPIASNPPPVAPGPGAVWYKVRFESGSVAIGNDGEQVLQQVEAALRRNPTLIATVIGKTDSVGSPDYNMHLSHQRADAVRDSLVYSGKIPAEQIETRWTGERRQDQATAQDVGASANRVVDIAVH